MQISLCRVQPRRRERHEQAKGRIVALTIMAALSSLHLAACTPTVATHGHTLDEAALAQIEPGRSSRQEVLQLLGSPSSLASFDDKTWYYVSQRTEKTSFYQEDLVAQDVIVVTFNDQGVVEGINSHGMDQMAAVDPVNRTTPTAGEAPSFFEQIIGNIGRFGGSSNTYDPDS